MAGPPNGVGVPVAERRLTDALREQAAGLVRPGSGRSLFHLEEVELDFGRPDSILVVASRNGLEARRRAGLRVPSLAHARMLGGLVDGRGTRYTKGYESRLRKEIRDIGWLRPDGTVRDVPRLVYRSVVIEAKIADWRKGIRQLMKVQWIAQEAALLMPHDTQHRVSRRWLRFTTDHFGLYVLGKDGAIVRRIKGKPSDVSRATDFWLTELVIRSLAAQEPPAA